jgi:hypothetical protein
MKKNLLYSLLLAACSLCGATLSSKAAPASERPLFHSLFSDHPVLQYDCAGMPAALFRTDDWLGITKG